MNGTRYIMRKGYIAIDAGKLQNDCYNIFAKGKLKTKATCVSKYLEEHDLCDSTFSNSFRNYERTERKDLTSVCNKDIVDHLYDVDNPSIERIGVMKSLYYAVIIDIFNLEDKYRLNKKKTSYIDSRPTNYSVNSDTIDAASAAALTAQVAELRTELRLLSKSILSLTEGIMKINGAKPKAVVIQK